MPDADEAARKEYAENGVDLPEQNEEPTEPTPEEPKPEEPKEPEAEEPKEPEAPKDEPLQEQPKEQRKRSIYHDLKEKKADLKTEKDLREQAERDRDALQAKLDALDDAGTAKEKSDAQDELDAFLASHKEWDKNALKDLIEIARKGVAPQLPEGLTKDLEEFKQWKAQNAHVMEQSMFEDEFKASLPAIKELFPKASEEELGAIKKELDSLSHTQEWHDKGLDYIAFKNRNTLGALVSPKKRGLEGKGRSEVTEASFDFDPNADLSKLSPAEYAEWEKQYQALGKTDGLLTDAAGKKTLL